MQDFHKISVEGYMVLAFHWQYMSNFHFTILFYLNIHCTVYEKYHTIPYHTIPYHTIPYHTIPYHTKGRKDEDAYKDVVG